MERSFSKLNVILPDMLKSSLNVVFCGSRPGDKSAKEKAYYAHPGNRFWPMLFEIGLLPRRFAPTEFTQVHDFGIGLTDLGKYSHGQDKGWKPTAADVDRLRMQVKQWQPKVLAFTSKTSAQYFLGKKIEYGRQDEKIADTVIYVLPSTSGANTARWDKSYWHELGRFFKIVKREIIRRDD
jgi:TDG/mug DNA glycosylase family protein